MEGRREQDQRARHPALRLKSGMRSCCKAGIAASGARSGTGGRLRCSRRPLPGSTTSSSYRRLKSTTMPARGCMPRSSPRSTRSTAWQGRSAWAQSGRLRRRCVMRSAPSFGIFHRAHRPQPCSCEPELVHSSPWTDTTVVDDRTTGPWSPSIGLNTISTRVPSDRGAGTLRGADLPRRSLGTRGSTPRHLRCCSS